MTAITSSAPRAAVADLPALHEALQLAAWAAFAASSGDDRAKVQRAVLDASARAMDAFPDGSELSGHFAAILGVIREDRNL
ncbi:MAG TPA: hypothetical protein VGG75_16045 [Trebonia sp.]